MKKILKVNLLDRIKKSGGENMKKIELNKTEKILAISSILLLVLTFSIYATTFTLSAQVQNYEAKMDLGSAFDTILEVTVKDKDGNIKDSRLKVGDLVLTNMAEVFRAVIKDVEVYNDYVYTSSAYFKDENAVGDSAYVKGPSSSNTYYGGLVGSYGGVYPQTKLAVGTGATAPNVGDVDLQNEVFTKEYIEADAVYSNGNVTFYGTIPCTSSETITEAGIYKYVYAGSGDTFYYMMLRDTFAGVSVVNEDTITLSYTLVLGEGYTDNFGKILEAFFVRYQTSTYTISLTDDSGGSFSAYLHGADSNWLFDTGSGSDQATMKIGTGTTSPARSDYNVETQVESYSDASVDPIYENSINYTTQATWLVTDDRQITEAGFFLQGKDTGGSDHYFMLFRDTFTMSAVSSGREISVTFKVYYNVG